MEYVLNHSMGLSDTTGVPDRRMRPQSAFVPSQSYYKSKDPEDDDLGRPVLQHKPLAKGKFTQLSLAKVFEDEPGMRPKVFAPPSVNKVSYGLMSFDIDRAVPQMKAAPNRPRDTNPMAPQYVLPGSRSIPVGQAAAAASATADGASGPPSSDRFQHPCRFGSGSPQRPNTLDVSDINAVTSVSERPDRMATRGSGLSTADIDGSWSGWAPGFRAHMDRSLRDPGLDGRDISGPPSRRRAFSARPSVSRSRDLTPHSAVSQSSPQAPPPQQLEQQQRQTYLPPPLSWQPVNGGHGQAGGQEELQPAAQEAALGTPAAAPAPEPRHAAGAWPTSITLPLRPTLAPPPFATHIPTGGPAMALAMAGSVSASTIQRTAAAADHPAATVGKPAPGRKDAPLRHAAKLAVADAQRAEAAEAQRVIAALRPSRGAMEEFWSSCRHLDREVCGKLTPADFAHALERSNLLASAPSSSGAEPTAVAAVLARGLMDGAGMVSYRYLARDLLTRVAPLRRSGSSSSSAAARSPQSPPLPPPPPPPPSAPPRAAAQPPAMQPGPAAAVAAGTGPGGDAAGPVAHVVVGPAIRPSSRPMSHQASRNNSGDGAGAQGGSATCPAPAASGGGGGDSDLNPAGNAGDPAAGLRRSVMWAPEPPVVIEEGPTQAPVGDIDARDVIRSSGSFRHPVPQQQQQQQRLQQSASLQSAHRPQSARPAAKGAVTAYFNLSPHAAAAAASSPAAAATAAAAGQALGLGPGWPPAPAAGSLQLRPPDSIMDTSRVELRDVVDVKYFPFKAHPYWFGGRAPAEPGGAEAPGGPAEAAREYQPSMDPLSMLVGRGQHRIGPTPTGHKLEPEVEAAIVARLRPSSALGTAPEANARAAAAANVMRQLRDDNPLHHPGAVNPSTPAGSALKSLLGSLYGPSNNSNNSSTGHLGVSVGGTGSSSTNRGARGGVRPATAGPSRGGSQSPARAVSVSRSISARVTGSLGGAGAVRVGRAALERQMHREEMAAVRSLC